MQSSLKWSPPKRALLLLAGETKTPPIEGKELFVLLLVATISIKVCLEPSESEHLLISLLTLLFDCANNHQTSEIKT